MMRAQTKLIGLMVALAATAIASTASAQDSDLILDMRMGSNTATDSSYDAIADDDAIPTYVLGVGSEISPALPGLRLGFEYEVNLPDSTDTYRLGDAAEFYWRRHRFMAVADWGIHVLDWLRPSARVGAGYSLQYLEATFGSQPTMTDYAHDLVVQASGGAEAILNLGQIGDSNVAFAFMGELGYQLQTDATFDELEFDDDAFAADDPWQRETVALGSIKTNGLFWNLGVGLRLGF